MYAYTVRKANKHLEPSSDTRNIHSSETGQYHRTLTLGLPLFVVFVSSRDVGAKARKEHEGTVHQVRIPNTRRRPAL